MQIEAAIRHAISQSLFIAKQFQKQTANFYPTNVGPYRKILEGDERIYQ